MRQFFDSAFQPPPGAGAGVADGFAILPQQSEQQLRLSAAHSRLDRVLNFLTRELGYSFLDDARPSRSGGVVLKARAGAVPPWRDDSKAHRLPADAPHVDSEEAQMCRIGPDASRYAQYPEDIILVKRFSHLLLEATPTASDKVNNDVFYKTVLQGVRLMHLCDFSYSDVVITLAYASVYFQTTFAAIGQQMSSLEAAHVCALLMYLAHSFVLDETCPLRCWATHVFRKYCNVKVLDAALYRLFYLRDFRLRVTVQEERDALDALLHAPNARGHIDVGDLAFGTAVASLKAQWHQHAYLGPGKLSRGSTVMRRASRLQHRGDPLAEQGRGPEGHGPQDASERRGTPGDREQRPGEGGAAPAAGAGARGPRAGEGARASGGACASRDGAAGPVRQDRLAVERDHFVPAVTA